LAEDDQEDNQVNEPGVALEGQDGFDTEERDDQTADRNDDDSDSGADFAVCHGIQSDATSDATRRAPAHLLDRVQHRDQLGRPPAKAIPADRDLAQTGRGAQTRAEARYRSSQD
jgi:hypothetical protein